jgi:isochorismate hydrolase
MKTRYFSIENIDQESHRMLQKLPDHEDRRISSFDPSNSALLILDMQSYFLDPSSHAYIPSAEAIVPGLRALARAYFENGLPVIFTQHLNTPEDAGSMATWWRDLISVEDPLSVIIPAFDFSNRYVLRKSQYDAFYETSLESLLHKRGVTQVIISGVMTHLCCETTARSAFVRGFDVFFLIDGTATYNEDHHLATLLNLGHGFATLVLVNEILDAVQSNFQNVTK